MLRHSKIPILSGKPKILLTLIFTVSMQFCFGQTYYPLVDTNKLWSIVQHNPSMGPSAVWKTYHIKFTEDTIIGLYQYKKIMRSSYNFPPTEWTNIGFIREDSNKKVYFKYNNENEILLYDFNVNINDTLNIFNLSMVVNTIDSALINEELRKKIILNPICTSSYWTTWIEGIGDLEGVLHSSCTNITCVGDSIVGINIGGENYELLCFFENDTLKYQNSNYGICYYSTLNVQEINKKKSIRIYPNPVIDISFIEIENNIKGNYILELYNVLGEKIKKIKILCNKKIKINRTDFNSSGIYLYKLYNTKNIIETGKILVI
jgi:hypothetical protein